MYACKDYSDINSNIVHILGSLLLDYFYGIA